MLKLWRLITIILTVRNFEKIKIEKIPFDGIAKLLRDVGLKKLADIVESLKEFDSVTDAFCIPPDFDDSYLNLGLGATLQKLSNIYRENHSLNG